MNAKQIKTAVQKALAQDQVAIQNRVEDALQGLMSDVKLEFFTGIVITAEEMSDEDNFAAHDIMNRALLQVLSGVLKSMKADSK